MIILEIMIYIVGFAIGSSLFFYFLDKIEEKKEKEGKLAKKIFIFDFKKSAAKGE